MGLKVALVGGVALGILSWCFIRRWHIGVDDSASVATDLHPKHAADDAQGGALEPTQEPGDSVLAKDAVVPVNLFLDTQPADPGNGPLNLTAAGILCTTWALWAPQQPIEFNVTRLVFFVLGLVLLVVSGALALRQAAVESQLWRTVYDLLRFLAPWVLKGILLVILVMILLFSTCAEKTIFTVR